METERQKQDREQRERLSAALALISNRDLNQRCLDILATGQPITKQNVWLFNDLLKNAQQANLAIDRLNTEPC